MKPKKFFSAASLAAGVALWGLAGCSQSAPPAPPPAPVVTVTTVKQKDVMEWDEFTGRTEASPANARCRRGRSGTWRDGRRGLARRRRSRLLKAACEIARFGTGQLVWIFWLAAISLRKPPIRLLDSLGFLWILSSESRLFNRLRQIFARRIFVDLFPALRAPRRAISLGSAMCKTKG